MAIISLDLAARSYADNGLAVLRSAGESIECEFISLIEHLQGKPDPDALASYLASLAETTNSNCLLIDGPQAWKARDNGLEHQRICEKALYTPGKTGEPGSVKPRSLTRFVEFSITLFDALADRGWSRLESPPTAAPAGRGALESFPTAAWRGLRLRPLPGKSRCSRTDLADHLQSLADLFPLKLSREPSHDELQALVAGIGGIALERGHLDFVEIVGCAPIQVDGAWREGFILGPALPRAIQRVRRLTPRN